MSILLDSVIIRRSNFSKSDSNNYVSFIVQTILKVVCPLHCTRLTRRSTHTGTVPFYSFLSRVPFTEAFVPLNIYGFFFRYSPNPTDKIIIPLDED